MKKKYFLKRRPSGRGFTMIELLVVMVIIGILVAIAVPQYFKVVERGRVADAINFISGINQSEGRYVVKYGGYLTTGGAGGLTNLDVAFEGNSPGYGMKNFNVSAVGANAGACIQAAGFSISLTRITGGGADNVNPKYGNYVITFDSCANPKLSCSTGACNTDLL